MGIKERPLAAASLAYLLGVALTDWLTMPSELAVGAFFAFAFALIASGGLLLWRQRREGIGVVLVGLMSFGTAWQQARQPKPRPSPDELLHFYQRGGTKLTVQGLVFSEPRHVPSYTAFELQPEKLAPLAVKRPYGRVQVLTVGNLKLELGDRVRFNARLMPILDATNPGAGVFERRQKRSGVFFKAFVEADEVKVIRKGAAYPFNRFRARLRREIFERFTKTMPKPYNEQAATVTASMVFGMHAVSFPKLLEDSARRAGVIHIFVVSGAQVSLLAVIIWTLFRPFNPLRVFLSLLGIAAYTFLTRGEPSISRAALMGSYLVIGNWLGMSVDLLTAWALSAALITFLSPSSPFSIGFQLSYAATFGLIFLAPPLLQLFLPKPERRTFHLRWLLPIPLLTFAAHLMTVPLLAHYFGTFSLVAPLANLIAIPLAVLLLPFALLSSLLVFVWTPLAQAVNFVNYFLAGFVVRITEAFASLSWASLPMRRITIGEVILCYALLLALGAALHAWARSRSKLSEERASLPLPA